MVVADNDEVDPREFLEADPWRRHAARADAKRAAGLSPDRLGQNIQAVGLHQPSRMADPGGNHPAALNMRFGLAGNQIYLVGPARTLVAAGDVSK